MLGPIIFPRFHNVPTPRLPIEPSLQRLTQGYLAIEFPELQQYFI
jgi:hypothetical protein